MDLSLIIRHLTYLTFLVNFPNQPFKSTFWINLYNQPFHWINGVTGLWYVAFSSKRTYVRGCTLTYWGTYDSGGCLLADHPLIKSWGVPHHHQIFVLWTFQTKFFILLNYDPLDFFKNHSTTPYTLRLIIWVKKQVPTINQASAPHILVNCNRTCLRYMSNLIFWVEKQVTTTGQALGTHCS